jgi:hypothetical protein
VLVVGRDVIPTAPIELTEPNQVKRWSAGSPISAGDCDEIIYSNTPHCGSLNINCNNIWIADDCQVTQGQRKACRVQFGFFNNDAGFPIDSVDVVLFNACPQAGGQQIPGSFQTFQGPFTNGVVHQVDLFLDNLPIPDVVWPATRVHLPNGHSQQAGALIACAAEIGFTENRYSRTTCNDTYGGLYAGMDLVIEGGFNVEDIGACCNDISGQCSDDVPQADCQELGDRWKIGQLCADLDPPCGEFNDECVVAQDITCGQTIQFSNLDATENLNDDPFVCSPDGQGQQPARTLYFKFTATATSATVSTCDTDGASDTIVSMYGSCDVFGEELGCDHDRCDPHARLCVDGLTIGEEYIVLVSQAIGGAPGNVTLQLSCTSECAEEPIGACCIAGGDLCFDMTEPDCRANSGNWRGEGTSCDDDPDPCSRSCGSGEVLWDNDLTPNGVNGRAISPPSFPNIRVVDDFVVPTGLVWRIEDFHFNVIEDAGWTDGNRVQVYVRAHDANTGGPVQGANNELVNVTVPSFTKRALGVQYFGRDDYDYCVLFGAQTFNLPGGRYWIGSRNISGAGAGTNYWMTSSGDPDGPDTPGWFSLDGGVSFSAEGATWDHAFTVTGGLGEAQNGACCHGDGTCEDGVPGDQCREQFDRFVADTLCANLNPPCSEVPGGCCIEGGGCTRNPVWVCDGDTDGDGQVNPVDSGLVQANFGSTDEQDLCNYDVDCDGQINPVDSGIVQSLFGTCNAPRAECGGGGGGECVVVGATDCADRGGQFLGNGTDCEDDPCGFATGACCVDGECVGTTREADCAGRWFSGGDCDAGFQCPGDACWDNNLVPDGVNGRALSPPAFPNIRVVDDVFVSSSCPLHNLHTNMIEDAGWVPSGTITVYVYDDGGGQPQNDGLVAEDTVSYIRMATGDEYFGRANYDYWIQNLAIDLPQGTYWVGTRDGNGGGAGSNYWMTSNGGPDGGPSSTGWFSLNGGTTFEAEGDGWHHAFEVQP